MALVEIKDGDYIAACEFEMRVTKDGDFDGDWKNNILRLFKKGDKLKQSLAIRLLNKLPEWVAKSDGKEIKPVENKDIKIAEEVRNPTKKELEEDWYAKNKATQVEELARLGLSSAEINKLTRESMRVDKIVELLMD